MKNIIIVLVGMLLLAGCNTPTLISERQIGITVPANFYKCTVTKLPASKDASDVVVAKLIADQHHDLRTCKNSIGHLHKYLDSINEVVKAN